MDNKEKSYIQTVIEEIKERNKDKIAEWKAKMPVPVEKLSGLDIDWVLAVPDDGIPKLSPKEREAFADELNRIADWCTKLLKDGKKLGEADLIDIRKIRRFIWVDCMIISFGGHDEALKWPEIRRLILANRDLLTRALF